MGGHNKVILLKNPRKMKVFALFGKKSHKMAPHYKMIFGVKKWKKWKMTLPTIKHRRVTISMFIFQAYSISVCLVFGSYRRQINKTGRYTIEYTLSYKN